ncbi:MAG: rhodanese-like domain-containing protein [Spirochaetaceae bacterium]|nr:rhodanese-like domain-containing protein [Spirochaetaceae bacterium]
MKTRTFAGRFLVALALAAALPATAIAAAPAAPSSARPAWAALPARLDEKRLAALLADKSSGILLLDVRTAEEFAAGRIPGALLHPYDGIETSFREPDKSRPIVVYCRSGRRSAIAAESLRRMGYSNVSDFGGLDRWSGKLER